MSKCQPCMSTNLKQVIRNFTDDPHTLKQIEAMPTCPMGEIMELCDGKPGKRKAGPYALFIGECMSKKPIKGKPFGAAAQYMRECAAEYKRQKGTQ